jgi:YD repeat-containing protein
VQSEPNRENLRAPVPGAQNPGANKLHAKREPTWYKVLLIVTVVTGATLIWYFEFHPRIAKVELLPFAESPPAWDGSTAYLTISLSEPGPDPVKFKVSVEKIAPTVRHDSPINEFQVDLYSGMFVLRQTDIFVSDIMPLSLTRTYRVWDSTSRAFGAGANHPYDICPTGSRYPYTYIDLNLEDGRSLYFPRISEGTGFADAVYRHELTSSEFFGAQLSWNGDGWTLIFRDGRRFRFPEAYSAKSFAQGAPVEMQDASGHRLQLKRDSNKNLEQLISPSGHTVSFKYDLADRIIEAADDEGTVRRYAYDSSGHLEGVSNATHVFYRFGYAPVLRTQGYDPYVMTSIIDGSGTVLLTNLYDEAGRISEQHIANGEVYRYKYLTDESFHVIETTVSGPKGEKKVHFEGGRATKED